MDIEAFLYMSLYETQQLESTAESSATVLLPIVLHKLSVPEARCTFWASLIGLDRAPQTNLSIKDACKYRTTVEKGLFAIRCLKKMELPTLIVYNIAEAFEQRLSDCSPDSPGYSEDRQRLLVARNELYWSETLRRLEMNEAGVSSITPDDSVSNCLAVKLLSLQGKKAIEGLSEDRRKAMRSRAEMVQADLSLHRNHVLKALSIYEKLDLPQAAWNQAQLLKLVALSGNPAIISGTQPRPPTSYDLLMRSQMILSEWTFREEVKQDLQMKQRFETEIQSLDKSIQNHRRLENSPEHLLDNLKDTSNACNVDDLHSGTFDQASAPSFSFPPQSAGPHSTPKRNIPNGSDTLTNEEQQLNMQLQFERMSLALKQRDDVISDLSKKNVELRGIVQNLQYYFTDQKVLFTNPKDPENAILRPEDLDILPTPQAPSTVHNLSGRNLSLSNNSPQYPFNNSASSNKSHTPLNRSLLDSSYQGDLTSDLLSPQIADQGANFESEYDDAQQNRPMLSVNVKSKPPFQFGYQTLGNPFTHLNLMGTGSGQSAPGRVPFSLNLPASRSGPTEPGLSSKDSNNSFGSLIKGNTSDNSKDDFVCTAEHDALVDLPLVKTETGEESEDIIFCQRGKLFRYRDNKWVERGVGDMKVLQQRNEHKFRLLMRREIVMKLCCNHLILSSLELKPHTDKSVLWSTYADFSEQTDSESLTLAIRFKTPEIKDEFVEAVNKCKHILKHSTRLKPSPDNSLKLASNASPQKESSPMGKLVPLSAQPPILMSFGPQLSNRSLNQSYSDSDDDTDVLSNNSDNEPPIDTKGPLIITSSSGEQTLFEEKTSLIVNDKKKIHDFGSLRIRIIGDSDRAQYRTILDKDGAILFDHEIRDIGDCSPYATAKNDKSWCWTLNKLEDQAKKSKFIVRFLTSAASEKFHAVMQDCIFKSRTHATSTTAIHSENIPPSSTPEKSSKYIFGMGALPGFTFNSQEHGQLFSGVTFMNLQSTPTPATESIQPEEASTSDNSYETDRYFEPVVVLPELKVLTTGEEQEEVLFFRRARLFRYLSKEWKERGIGELKILLNPETGRHRILMRRDVVKKVCCNHYITQDMIIKRNQSSEVTMNWYTPADFSDEVQQPEQFAARFKTVEIADDFEKIFNQCILGIKASQSPQIPERSTDAKKDFDTDDVIIISVSQPTEHQIRRARELMLPDCFYLYEDKPACPGCRGCDDRFSLEHSGGEESNEKISATKELKMEAREEIPVKPGSIFGGNLGNFSFSSLVPSQTQTSSTNPFAKVVKSVNEDRGDTGKPNVPDSPVAAPQIDEVTERVEKVLFSRRAALHRLVSLEWKQRGEGDLKLFHNQQTGKYRVEMRRDPGESICCSHFITTYIKLGLLENDESTCIWDAVADLSEETPQNERFSARFKTPETANEFREVIDECQLELMNRTLVPICASTTTDAADILPDTKDDKTPDTNSKNEDNNCLGAEQVPPSDNAELSTDDVIFVCAYEPTSAQIAIIEQYQLPRYFFSYEDKPPCPGCRGCHDDLDIVYEKDSETLEQPQATEDVESKLRDASEEDSTCELKQERVKPTLFGPQVDAEISFTKLAQSDDVAKGFSCQGNPFKSYARPLFAASSEEGGDPLDSEPDAHFKPIVQLPEIHDLRTGEEGEEELFNKYTVLFRFDDKQWKERGRGDIKILYNSDTEMYRIIMRRTQVKKICCNHFITSVMTLKPVQKSENCWLWHTNSDSSEEEPRPETLTVKFKKPDVANEFKQVFDRCVSSLQALKKY